MFDPGTGAPSPHPERRNTDRQSRLSPENFRVLDDLPPQSGARTMTLAAKTRDIRLLTASMAMVRLTRMLPQTQVRRTLVAFLNDDAAASAAKVARSLKFRRTRTVCTCDPLSEGRSLSPAFTESEGKSADDDGDKAQTLCDWASERRLQDVYRVLPR